MSLTISQLSVPAFVRGLQILSTLLAKAEQHATDAGTDPSAMLATRLIDDMLPLSAQVQRASDTSKFAIQRLSGGEAPKFADEEQTFAELQTRITNTIAYLESVAAADLDAAAEREVILPYGPKSVVFTGQSYLLTFALPNFYFHIVTAYDILRQQGVKIGKPDYLGQFDMRG